jgi:hypothetical protein
MGASSAPATPWAPSPWTGVTRSQVYLLDLGCIRGREQLTGGFYLETDNVRLLISQRGILS